MEPDSTADAGLAALTTPGPWQGLLDPRAAARLGPALARWLAGRRWFGGKARVVRGVAIRDAVAVPMGEREARLALLRVDYEEGRPDLYALPLAFASGPRAEAARASGAALAALEAAGERGVLHAADGEPAFARALLDAVARGRSFPGGEGELVAWPTSAFAARARGAAALEPAPLAGEQSNTSIRFGDRLVLKLFRRTEPGPNPDLEIGAFLTEEARFPHVPPLLGGIEYRPRRGEAIAVAVLHAFVPNQGDAWAFTLRAVADALGRLGDPGPEPGPPSALLARAAAPPPPAALALLGPYAAAAALLGRRTAELHAALASARDRPAFAPEPFSDEDRAALAAAARSRVRAACALLAERRGSLADGARALADAVLAREAELDARVRAAAARPLRALRTRTHGDYHLGQVLWTGRDFVIIDFEGEPARPLAERRAKASPLRDVAGMLRSFHYAAHQGLAGSAAGDPAAAARAGEGARAWCRWASAAFLRGWLEGSRGAAFVPPPEELEALLDLFLLEKAAYEVAYELNHRPAWVALPLQGLLERPDAA